MNAALIGMFCFGMACGMAFVSILLWCLWPAIQRGKFMSPAKHLPPEGKRVLLRLKSDSPRYVVGARLPGNKWINDLCHLRAPLDQSEIDAWREI